MCAWWQGGAVASTVASKPEGFRFNAYSGLSLWSLYALLMPALVKSG